MAKKTKKASSSTSRRLNGSYLGHTRHASAAAKAKAKKIRASKGVRAAIAFLKKTKSKSRGGKKSARR